MVTNSNMHKAKREKNDEFFTQLSDIESELEHYENQFKDRVVYCNCDDKNSEFFKYFALKFKSLGLRGLFATKYNKGSKGLLTEFKGFNKPPKGKELNYHRDLVIVETPLDGDGDFRSEECLSVLKIADVVVTNPPFSLFREFVSVLMDKEKEFLIIGNNNAITYKEIFSHIKNNKMWLGVHNNKTLEFRLDKSYEVYNRIDEAGNKYGKVPACSWFTNLKHKKRNMPLPLFRTTKGPKVKASMTYDKYDNYDAIEVPRVKDIPCDYDGAMGVPITFLDGYCPEQFEILDINPHFFSIVENGGVKPKQLSIKGKKDPYARIIIKRRK